MKFLRGFMGRKDKSVIIHIGIYIPEWSKLCNCDDDVFRLLMTSQRCQNKPIHYPVGRRMQIIKDNSK